MTAALSAAQYALLAAAGSEAGAHLDADNEADLRVLRRCGLVAVAVDGSHRLTPTGGRFAEIEARARLSRAPTIV